MKPLLITSKEASFLSVRHHQWLFTDYINRTEALYRARQLPFNSIIIYKAGGNVSFEAVRFLMQNGVPIVHLSWGGTQVAVTLPPGRISGELRLAQYQAFLDKKRREQLAWVFVREKVAKSIDMLRILKRRYPMIDTEWFGRVSTKEFLMGVEGKAAEAYWLEFAKIVRRAQSKFEFLGRKTSSNNMGACDPVSSLSNLSVDEPKKLRISKTTHFHMRKNLREGKPIRVYDKTRTKLHYSEQFHGSSML